MLVFDAYLLAAVLLGEPAGNTISELLGASIHESVVSAINAAEVVDIVARTRSVEPMRVAGAIELWVEGGLDVTALDWLTGKRAAELRATNYHRTRSPVSLADCCAIALAEQLDATLVTSDQPMLRIASECGVDVRAVPDSNG